MNNIVNYYYFTVSINASIILMFKLLIYFGEV
jgi:hypothetical protein